MNRRSRGPEQRNQSLEAARGCRAGAEVGGPWEDRPWPADQKPRKVGRDENSFRPALGWSVGDRFKRAANGVKETGRKQAQSPGGIQGLREGKETRRRTHEDAGDSG